MLALPLGGTTVDCVRFGQGEKALVLLPGLSLRGVRERAHALAHMYRTFGTEYRVYILDNAQRLPEPCTVRALADDAARAMDVLGIRQADVFGISMGGMIAQYLALDRPELVRKLVLAVTLSRPNDTMRAASRRWGELAERDDYGELVRDIMARTYSDAFLKRFGQLLPAVSQIDRPAELGRFMALERGCLSCDTYERLGQLRCPVFVVGARLDNVVGGQASEEIAEKLGCGLYIYEQLGHAACEEARDFNDRVLAFLRQ